MPNRHIIKIDSPKIWGQVADVVFRSMQLGDDI